ncbi:MAG: hypothetical protein IKC32_06050 [Clostridia bacterium]|nr:hypothetical protein [Clostridia bacterium]
MTEVITDGKRIYTFTDTGFEITVKPPTLKNRLICVLIIVFFLSMFLFALALAIIDGSIGHIIIFSFACILGVLLAVYFSYSPIFNNKPFRLTVDERGITDEWFDNYIKWEDLICFGFINGVLLHRRSFYHQICIYFSTTPYDEKKYKRALHFRHAGLFAPRTNEMISYGFGKNQLDEELIKKIRERIYLYADKEKEISDIRPDSEFVYP